MAYDYIVNIHKLMNANKTFTDKEMDDLLSSVESTIKEYLVNHVINMMYNDFDRNLTNYIYDLHIGFLEPLFDGESRFLLEYKLLHIIRCVKHNMYINYIPIRSYPDSFIRKLTPNYFNLENKIYTLQNIEQPVQRTEEWYKFRHNLLTASSIWKVFGSQSMQNQLIYEKCKPYTQYNNVSMDSPMHWGQKYEPISTQLYEQMYNTKVADFGCIRHPKYSFIGASPDGITIHMNNSRYARMLEIKNIVNRIINGIPKMEYWIQMQIQMETCNLNECDFLETKFVEYDNEDAFNEDGTFTHATDNSPKGIMILFSKDNNFHYEYPPITICREKYNEWEESILSKNKDLIWISNIYWKLEKMSNVLVLRNKHWFEAALPEIENLWKTIIRERVTGYEHREPKKRKAPTSLFGNKCLVKL